MSKCSITKITQFANAIVAKAPNRIITYTKQEDGGHLIEFVRSLSKEEQEALKDAPTQGNQHVVRGRVLVTGLLLSDEAFENLRVFLNVVSDIDSNKEQEKPLEV